MSPAERLRWCRVDQKRSRRASLNEPMAEPINAAAVAALADEPLDWRFKGLPAAWWGRTPADVCAGARICSTTAPSDPSVCCAPRRWRTTSRRWRRGVATDGVELAPHGKTHMAPQLLARQFARVRVPSPSRPSARLRAYRAFGVRDVVLANELVDGAALRWVAAELDADPDFTLVCWVDSVAASRQMASRLEAAGAAQARGRVRRDRHGGRPHGLPRRAGRVTRWRGPQRTVRPCGWSAWPATKRRSVTMSGPTRWPRSGPIWRRSARPLLRLAAALRDRPRHRNRGRQHVLRHRRRRVGAVTGGRIMPQRLLSHPRRRAVRQDVAAARWAATGAGSVGAGDVATGAGPGTADDGPPRRVVRPGHAGAARPDGQLASPSSTTNTPT